MSKTRTRNPESPSFYDPNVALSFFRSTGKERSVAMGTTIFSESSVGMPLLLMPSRIYLLLQGEVEVVADGEPIATLVAGEIFGEMASLGMRSSGMPTLFSEKMVVPIATERSLPVERKKLSATFGS